MVKITKKLDNNYFLKVKENPKKYSSINKERLIEILSNMGYDIDIQIAYFSFMRKTFYAYFEIFCDEKKLKNDIKNIFDEVEFI